MHVLYVMRKSLENLQVYEEEVGGLSFDVKVMKSPDLWRRKPEIHYVPLYPFLYIRGAGFVWIFFQGGKQPDCGKDRKQRRWC